MAKHKQMAEPGRPWTGKAKSQPIDCAVTFAGVEPRGLAVLSLVVIPGRPFGGEDVKRRKTLPPHCPPERTHNEPQRHPAALPLFSLCFPHAAGAKWISRKRPGLRSAKARAAPERTGSAMEAEVGGGPAVVGFGLRWAGGWCGSCLGWPITFVQPIISSGRQFGRMTTLEKRASVWKLAQGVLKSSKN